MSDARMLGDRYEVGDVIGRGGMAEVHEGRDRRLGRRVAIKILRPDLAKDPTFQTRFRREAQSAAALNHPNIVAVYDTGEDLLDSVDGSAAVTVPYIVMEYVDGMTLRQLLASGRRLLPERALEITAGVLSALDYAHRHGIVHRDIKPANVMLTRTGDVKVMDFGIARAINDVGTTMTSASAVMGTAQYLSPEQARGEVVDARSDLYSTGVLLYELLTGQPPFTGESAVAIAYQHVSEMPTPPSHVDDAVSAEDDAIVLRALAKRVDDRYQTAADFRDDIERAMRGAPVTAAVPAIVADPTTMMAPVTAAMPAVGDPYARSGRRGGGRSFGFWFISLLAIIGAIAGAWFIGQFLLGGGGGARVQVPNLDGLTVEQAETRLGEFDLRLGAQTPELSDRPEGTVIAQQPAAGEQLETGQAVNVTISSGLEQSTVPPLVGLISAQDAQIALEDAGLQLGEVIQEDSDQPAGYVLSSSPVEGTEVEAGTPVSITVSSGLVTVPRVRGSMEAQARADLAALGLEVSATYQVDEVTPAGQVLAQSPKAGTSVEKGSVVTITIAVRAPEPPQPSPTDTPINEPTDLPSAPATDGPPAFSGSVAPAPSPTP